MYFHPAHPDRSAIDPRNWNRKDRAGQSKRRSSRLETGADPFTAFGWKVLNDITNGISPGNRPNLVQLRRYVEGGPEKPVATRPSRSISPPMCGTGESRWAYLRKYKDRQLQAHVAFYQEVGINEASRSIWMA